MTSIFVAKLDFGVTVDELKALFEAYGDVKKAHIATDRETGKPRGFAFVEMYNKDQAQKAIAELDGKNINGRDIAVKEAEDRRGNNSTPRKDFKASGEFKPREVSEPRGTSDEVDKPKREAGDFSAPIKIPNDDFGSDDSTRTEKRRKNNPSKSKEVDNTVDGGNKKKKLNPYKKSGKDQIIIDEDDDLEGYDPFGLDDDIEVDDDVMSNYLVNSDEEEDFEEDYDDDFEEDYDEDDNW